MSWVVSVYFDDDEEVRSQTCFDELVRVYGKHHVVARINEPEEDQR